MISNVTMEFNNCTNTTNISESVEEYLQQLQDKTNITMIPAVTMLIVFAVTGFIGNSLVLVVYSQKFKLSPTKVLIMTIAIFDLVANVGAIPSEINTVFDSWNFSQPGVCKLRVFLAAFTTLGGAISLLVVAVVRYRKVCRPYGWQMNIRQAKIASFVTSLITFILSIPYVIIFGVKTRQTPCSKIKGYECFVNDHYFYTIWPLMNNLLYILVVLCLSASLVILYILIELTARRHRKHHGLSVELSKTKSKEGSTTGVPSEIKASQQLQLQIQTAHASHFMKRLPETHVRDHRASRSLLCCVEQRANVESAYSSQASSIMKDYTLTTDTGETNSGMKSSEMTSEEVVSQEVMQSEDNVVVTSNLESPLCFNIPHEASPCECTDNKNLVGTELRGKPEMKEQENRVEQRQNESSTSKSYTREDNSFSNNEDRQNDENPENDESENLHNTTVTKQSTPQLQGPDKKGDKSKPLNRMTAMLIIISAIYIIGFFPFLALTVIRTRLPEKYASLDMVELSFYNLFYRLYFLNSAANPIIYSLCDLNFRRQCFRLLTYKSRGRL